MKARYVLSIGIASFALGAAACGGFLGLTGDDDDPPAPPASIPDGGDSADPSTSEGGASVASVDGSLPDAGGDAEPFVYGATCGGTRCGPNVPCCIPSGTSVLACEANDGDCPTMALLCTRKRDCATNESCCITRDTTSSKTSSRCVAGPCPADGNDQLCDPADKDHVADCAPRICTTSGSASIIYKLPPTLGICE